MLKTLSVFVVYKTPDQIAGVLLAKCKRDAKIAADGRWKGIHSIEELSDKTLEDLTESSEVFYVLSVRYGLDGRPQDVKRGW